MNGGRHIAKEDMKLFIFFFSYQFSKKFKRILRSDKDVFLYWAFLYTSVSF